MQNGGGARRRGMRVDVGEPRLDFGDVMAVMRSLGARQQFGAFDIGRQHEIDERRRPARRLLLDAPQPRAAGQRNGPAFGRDLAADQPEQRGLARAVAADEARARARGEKNPGVIEQQAVAEPVSEIVDGEHRRDALGLGRGRRKRGQWVAPRRAWRRPSLVALVLRSARLYTRPRAAARRPNGPRPSSRGLGRRPFTAKTGVRIPLGAPIKSMI